MKILTLLLVIPFALFLVFRCSFGGQITSWHQRLTVTVTTPVGEVQGASVTEVRMSDDRGALQLPESAGVHARYTGEAVVVEVTPGRYLFALLGGGEGWESDAAHWSYAAFDLAPSNSTDFRDSMAKLKAQPLNTPAALPARAWPMFVTFTDIADPKTVQLVDPDDLDATFGCRPVDPALAPWRGSGLLYRQWAEAETLRLANAGAAERAGITGAAAAALDERYKILKPNWGPTDEEKARLKVLALQFTPDQDDRWRAARKALLAELPATLPEPQKLAEETGGACYAFKSVTLEVTREPMTGGQVDGVLGWLRRIWPNRLDGNRFGPIASKTNLASTLEVGFFSTEIKK